MLHQPVQQAPGDAGSGDLSIPLAQNVPSQGRETDPFGEPLAVHLAAQHPQLDQPDQMIFGAVGTELAATDVVPILPCRELAAAEGALFQLLVEGKPKRQAAHRLVGAPQSVLVVAGGRWGGHAQASLAAILLVGAAL